MLSNLFLMNIFVILNNLHVHRHQANDDLL